MGIHAMQNESIRFIAAKFVLGMATSDELSQFGDEMLNAGVYTDSLMELATERYPIWSEVSPLFKKALRELNFQLPSEQLAPQIAVSKFIGDIAEGRVTPVEGIEQFYREF